MELGTLFTVLLQVASAAVISALLVLVSRFLYRTFAYSADKQATQIKEDCEKAIKKK